MFQPDDFEQIVQREILRQIVRKQFENESVHRQTRPAIWNILNSGFVLWCLSTLSRISQMTSPVLACDLRYTLEKQGCSANLCQADRGTQWVNAKTRNYGSVLTAA